MKNYILNEDEVILFRGMISQFYDWKEEKNANTYDTELLLTNFNLVLSGNEEASLPDATPQLFAVKDIKVYDKKIQILRRKSTVEIYHKSGEIYLSFELEKEARKFCDAVIKLHSGYTKFVRTVMTAEKIIEENTEPLGIDAKQLAKATASAAYTAISTHASNNKKWVGAAARAVADAIQSANNKKASLPTASKENED